ncbi:hypothetical protein [Halomicrococcus gelatinilyticus]|jgi:hypothetical protein|uniref:hypothetical protein n=1 Tax=Halomicrococcus gelatinilyticus TaxID=1702103 RepID=UPI002E104EC7
MAEKIVNAPNSNVTLEDGTTITNVHVAVYPDWVEIQTREVNQYFPREQVREVKTER